MDTVPAKSILIRNKSTAWFGCTYNMNLYRGCCHGCLYCDSRSDCYQVTDFDRVRAKENALVLLRGELARKTRTDMVATGAMSDPYNPFEKTERLTRHALELLAAYGFGVGIATKSTLIVRDIDVLQEVAATAPVVCKVTVTTTDDALAQKLEPHAPFSSARFAAIEKLAGAGLFTGVLLMPVMPFLEDSEENIRALVARTADCGGRFIFGSMGVTLRNGQREYLYAKLEEAFPGEGFAKRYAARYGQRYHAASPRARALWQVFTQSCRERGLLYEMPDIVAAYKLGYGSSQLSLFDR